jgi:hypothetical protein
VRVYVPATLPMLEKWLVVGEAAPPEGVSLQTVYAVTPSLREWYHDADLDELEHAAQVAASVGSLGLLAADADASRRRVVVAADVEEGSLSPQAGRAEMRLSGSIPVTRWASALVDGPDAESVVTAAVAAIAAAAAGDDDAQFAIDEAEAQELGWYAVQELRDLLA